MQKFIKPILGSGGNKCLLQQLTRLAWQSTLQTYHALLGDDATPGGQLRRDRSDIRNITQVAEANRYRRL